MFVNVRLDVADVRGGLLTERIIILYRYIENDTTDSTIYIIKMQITE